MEEKNENNYSHNILRKSGNRVLDRLRMGIIRNIKDIVRPIFLRIMMIKETILGIDFSQPKENAIDLEHVSYAASTNRVLKMFRKLSITDEDCILDVGCGKGKVINMLYSFPFKNIDGLEYDTQLVSLCMRNMKKLKRKRTKLYCEDAARFTHLDAYTYMYMFNPFKGQTMEKFVDNILDSYNRKKRRICIVYLNPQCSNIFIKKGFKVIYEWKGFMVYQLDGK